MTPEEDPLAVVRSIVWGVPISIALWCLIALVAGVVARG
jgi:hypothetical protein